MLMQDFTDETHDDKQDRFTVVKLTEDGKQNWQYQYLKDSLKEGADQEVFSVLPIDKNLFITASQKTVIYGNTHQSANGSILVCLDEKGKETSNRVFENYDWTHWVEWPQNGFALFNSSENREKKYFFSVFDQNCQKTKDQFIDGYGEPLEVTLAILPETNEVLISVQNSLGEDPASTVREQGSWRPKVYKVKLQ